MKRTMYARPHKYQCAGTDTSLKKKNQTNHPPKAITCLQ